MDPQVSTSFIPKQALAEEKARAGGMGIFFLLSLFLFVLSLVGAGLAFAYGNLLNQQLSGKKAQLVVEKGAFDPATIQALVRLDTRITQAKVLLTKHVAPLSLFNFLAQNTLVNVQFTSFDYKLNQDGTGSMQLEGVADSFSTLALQSDALGKSTQLKDVIFSSIAVNPTGSVGFQVSATVAPALLSYASAHAAEAAAPADTAVTTASSTTP